MHLLRIQEQIRTASRPMQPQRLYTICSRRNFVESVASTACVPQSYHLSYVSQCHCIQNKYKILKQLVYRTSSLLAADKLGKLLGAHKQVGEAAALRCCYRPGLYCLPQSHRQRKGNIRSLIKYKGQKKPAQANAAAGCASLASPSHFIITVTCIPSQSISCRLGSEAGCTRYHVCRLQHSTDSSASDFDLNHINDKF